MRTQLAGLTTLALGLALGLGASAQTRDNDKDKDKGTAKQMTVHGVIASVTVEGELAIDYKAKKAVEAEMTFVTIIGSPRGERRDGDNAARNNDRDNAARKGNREAGDRDNRRAERRRHNVYVVWLTPKTQFRDAEAGDNKDKDKALTLNDLEVGDRVEVTFNVRDETNAGAQNQTEEIRRKHGRHRTYFGDATSISLLAEPGADRDRNRDNADRNRNRDNESKDQAKEKK